MRERDGDMLYDSRGDNYRLFPGGSPAQDAALQHPPLHGLRVEALARHRDAVVRGLLAVPASARAGDALPHAVPHRRGAADGAGHGLSPRQEYYPQVNLFSLMFM